MLNAKRSSIASNSQADKLRQVQPEAKKIGPHKIPVINLNDIEPNCPEEVNDPSPLSEQVPVINNLYISTRSLKQSVENHFVSVKTKSSKYVPPPPVVVHNSFKQVEVSRPVVVRTSTKKAVVLPIQPLTPISRLQEVPKLKPDEADIESENEMDSVK